MVFRSSNYLGRRILPCFIVATGMSLTSPLTHAASAQPYVLQTPTATPLPGTVIPSSAQVPGKHYSDRLDENSIGAADPMQVLRWDGIGGVEDGPDFTPLFATAYEIDAIANKQDVLLKSVINNTSALLFSVENDGGIYTHSIGGSSSIWANPGTINALHPPEDVDGLNVWEDTTNLYSLTGDSTGASIYDELGVSIVTTTDIAGAIGQPGLVGSIDIDALMFNKKSSGGFTMLFSIAPVAGLFDGGEIWTWDGVNPATFLNQGGHIWDTTHCVMCEFSTIQNENINALEAVSAVPLPAAVWLFGSGLLGLFGAARQKKSVS